MSLWMIEPRDPLIVRDGRPFGLNPGARAVSLGFPFPSTIAGGLRTRAWRAAGGVFDDSGIEAVKQIGLRGPLLVEFSAESYGGVQYYAPAPADAVVFPVGEKAEEVRIHQLAPEGQPAGCGTDLQTDTVVGMLEPNREKPMRTPPRFWSWAAFGQWLSSPAPTKTLDVDELGCAGPNLDLRVHVSIRRDSQTAEDGRLFMTRGLEFLYGTGATASARRLGLAIEADDPGNAVGAMDDGFTPLGGERRLVYWQRQASERSLPACPPALRTAIMTAGRCRVVLLTPAYFVKGYYPSSLSSLIPGLEIEIAASAVGRSQTVSGWDMAAGTPKRSRRLAPAGSVYFLKFKGDEAAIGRFVDRVWMRCVSDGISGGDIGQDNRDGFGLAVVGMWSKENNNA